MKDKKKGVRKSNSFLIIIVIFTLLNITFLMTNIDQRNKIKQELPKEIENFYDGFYDVIRPFENQSDKITGLYNTRTERILIFTKKRSLSKVIKTSYHEVCHYVADRFLTKEQWNEYELIYNSSSFIDRFYYKKAHDEDAIEEEFATSCSDWFYYRELSDKTKQDYMEKYVKVWI